MPRIEWQRIRDVIADDLAATTHTASPEFIRQLRAGEQDDGPFVRGGTAVFRSWPLDNEDAAREAIAQMIDGSTPSPTYCDELRAGDHPRSPFLIGGMAVFRMMEK